MPDTVRHTKYLSEAPRDADPELRQETRTRMYGTRTSAQPGDIELPNRSGKVDPSVAQRQSVQRQEQFFAGERASKRAVAANREPSSINPLTRLAQRVRTFSSGRR